MTANAVPSSRNQRNEYKFRTRGKKKGIRTEPKAGLLSRGVGASELPLIGLTARGMGAEI